jgi:hypothetical protein
MPPVWQARPLGHNCRNKQPKKDE